MFAEVAKMLYGAEVDVREVWDIAKMNDASEVHVDGSGKQKDSKGRKALVGGLLFGSGAEGLAVHRSFLNLNKPKIGAEAKHLKPTRVSAAMGPVKAFAHTKTGRAAELGIQAVNLGVGLTAARELVKKPKSTIAKKRLVKPPGVRVARGNAKRADFRKLSRIPEHAAKVGPVQRGLSTANYHLTRNAPKIHGALAQVVDLTKSRRHIAPQVLHAANGRARRNGLRLVGATATTAAGGAGYAVGRRNPAPAPPVTSVAKASDKRERAHRLSLGSNAIAGSAGAAFGAAKLRDAYGDQYPESFKGGLRRVASGKHSASSLGTRVARVAEHGKPGFKTIAAGTIAGGVAAAAHQYGQHLDHRSKRVAKALEWQGTVSKVNEEKRQVFGWASLSVVDGERVVDLQDDYVPIEEIEKSAYTYVLESRKGGDMHERVSKLATAPRHTADLIESVVVTPEKLEAWGLEPDAMPLGWWTGFYVHDDQQWQKVLDGERLGFSIHGTGIRRELVSA